ncbi:MAG: phosphoglycerate dehydrogenase [Acidobacteriota bacterium]|nr:phosphoglycerate dehydrogenase [Acidobacteriota bacterium]
MTRILISDPLNEAGLEIFRQAGADIELLAAEDKHRLVELLPEFDALVVRSGTRVTAELLRAGKRLKVVGRAGIGVDNVDVSAATELGILVVNAPTANLISATEHTFAVLLALARNVPSADASVKAGEWDRKRFLGHELNGRTMGVVGLGRIGQAVALRGRAFGMNIIAYDPFLDPAVARRLEIELVSMDEVADQAGVLTLHVPLTDDTRNILNAERIGRLREGTIVVNCARGGVLDEVALLAGLESGRIAGAALDVFTNEPPADFALIRHPRVVATPHIGAQTREAQERVATQTAKMVLDALAGSLAVTAVNLPFSAAGKHSEPFLGLSEQLGRLASSLLDGSLNQIQIDLWGIDKELRAAITVAAVKGALNPFLGDSVTYVNAERIAADRGIEVIRATHQRSREHPHMVGVTLSGETGSIEVAGTIVGEADPRVVRFRGFRLEFRPAGKLLVLQNRDVPGVVGKVGTLLGDAGANIAGIHLAREVDEKDAVAVIRLDEVPSESVVRGLAALPEVLSVKLVELG